MAIDKELLADLQLWTVKELKGQKEILEKTIEMSPHDKSAIELLSEIDNVLKDRN